MSVERFETGKKFFWNGEEYEIRKRLQAGKGLNVMDLHTGEVQTVSFSALLKALFDGELWFDGNGRGPERPVKEGYLVPSDAPSELQEVKDYRMEVISPLLKLSPSERKEAIPKRVEEYKEKHKGEEPGLLAAISEASIYRWIADFEASGGEDTALIPDTEKRGGAGKSRLQPTVEGIITVTIEDLKDVGEVRTVEYIRNEIAVRIAEANRQRVSWDQLKKPSRATVARRVAELDLEGKLVPRRSRGKEREKGKAVGETDYPTIPLERVEIDHTRTDIVVVDEEDYLPLGKLTLTYCLDMATRYPLGYYLGFEPCSYYAVMQCLYHAICPKGDVRELYGTEHDWITYGIPYMLITDNGKEFIGKDLLDACSILSVILQRTPVKTPYFKAGVERIFDTTNTGVFHTLPGTSFADPAQRGNYNSLKHACISLNDLDQILHIFLLDIYAEDFHRGLNGIPARRWEDAIEKGFFPRVPPSVQELQILLGRVEDRTIQPYGIEFESLRYNSSDLIPLRTRMSKQDDKKVKFKYNPGDLGCIWVRDPFNNEYIEVPAVGKQYATGLSLWKHRVIRNLVLCEQGKVDIVALGLAQRKIQRIVEESMNAKKSSLRSKQARWLTGGRGPGREQDVESESVDSPVGEEIDELLAPSLPEIDIQALKEMGWGVSHTVVGGGK
jgi:putative transposase